MGDEFFICALVGLVLLILLPVALIFAATWIVSKVVKASFSTHAALGIIGVPIHEMAHAVACLLFRMPIIKARLYAPNYETGNLGYVTFAYNPRSAFHAVGLLVQGVAPLTAACMILGFLFPVQTVDYIFLDAAENNWLMGSAVDGINQGLSLTLGNLMLDMEGAVWALLALLIAAYSIPSWSDVRIALRGVVVTTVFIIAFCALLSMGEELAPIGLKKEVGLVVEYLKSTILDAAGSAIRSVTMVIFVSLIGLLCIQVMPALIACGIKVLTEGSRKAERKKSGNCRP